MTEARTVKLLLLSGGAAFGLIEVVRNKFESDNSCRIEGEFAAVGFTKDKLLAGAACDAIILSRKLIDQLSDSHVVDSNTVRDLGWVSTGAAVRTGQEKARIGTAEDLERALLAADKIFVPNMEKSTAGLHMKAVFNNLGLFDRIRPKISEYSGGAAAMEALALEPAGYCIGFTQVTEILCTSGVDLIGKLPSGCELNTIYSVAIPAVSRQTRLAEKLIELLADPSLCELKTATGFETRPAQEINYMIKGV
jgi:molybdate transport system substrate-binding protein